MGVPTATATPPLAGADEPPLAAARRTAGPAAAAGVGLSSQALAEAVPEAAAAAQRPTPPAPPPTNGSTSSSSGGVSGVVGTAPQQRQSPRQSPSLRMLLSQQRKQLPQQPAWPQQGQQGQQAQQLAPRRGQPAFLSYSQQRQQHEQGQILQQQYFRQQHLRVPYWVRAVAEEMLQAVAAVDAAGGAGAGASGIAGLGIYDPPQALMDQLHPLLPPFVDSTAQQQPLPPPQQAAEQQADEDEPGESLAAEQQQQQQQQEELAEEQQEEEELEEEEEQEQEPLPQEAAAEAGDIFAAELARILSHYEQSSSEAAAAAAAEEEESVDGAVPVGTSAEGTSVGSEASSGTTSVAEPAEAAASGAASDAARSQPRQRRVDDGGFLLLLRAVALMASRRRCRCHCCCCCRHTMLLGDGMRGAIALLLAADAGGGGYPTRSNDIMAAMLKLANSLLEDEAAVVLVHLAKQWGVELDRGMWQHVLDVCAKAGKAEVVLAMMQEMEARGLPPDSVAHTILVMAHEKAGAWREALAAYRHMRDRGLERNSFTYRRALAGSGPGPAFLWAGGGAAAGGSAGRNPQSGCQASPVSPRLASPAHAACLALVSALVGADRLGDACEVLDWMADDGVAGNAVVYQTLINAFLERDRQDKVDWLLERMRRDGRGRAPGAARWPAVLRIIHGMQMGLPNYRDTHVQTVAVSVAAKDGRLEDALAVYRLMLQDGVQPKAPTFNALIAACMRAGQPAKGFRFLEVMQGMGADVVTVSTLIACCERLGDWQRARDVWQWMVDQGLEPDTICYNTMISCMERCNQPDRALAVFEQMSEAGVAGSSATYATLCDVFAKQGNWAKLRTAVQVKEWMEAQGEDPAQLTYAELMVRASEGGNWKRALELFEGMESSLTISGSQPNAVTYSAAIIACARLADWQRAVELKDQMLARGLPASPIVYNSVLAACEASRQLDAALDLLDEMRVAGVPRDQYTYSTLMSCCYHGEGHLGPAMRLFQEMQEEGLTPNIVVVNALLSVCATVGDADAASRVYRHATGALGMPADEITMHCMMEVIGRAGRWAEGLAFFAASYREQGSYRGVLQLDLSKPDTAAQLDLHFLSVVGARIVLRGWLLHLKRRALRGEQLDPGFKFRIVTGWGRNSANNVPRLKPEVGRMLQQEMGPALALLEPASNLGVYHVEQRSMYDWLLNEAQLGFDAREEEEAWLVMEQLHAYQQQEKRRKGPAAQQRPEQRQPAPLGSAGLQPRYEGVAWMPPSAQPAASSGEEEAQAEAM
ncbi:hypothetical protein CHLNCDRAFT_51958 [Chlorella variabilis]|uniref:Smr domain-containing protein n=1 Tax=Chlorella variabilis TaxID=554065 RepID=E1ZCN4_CHLVA|nr:hypothetical protein CHLNCDRAFT_51958 [Chlorella variabilis]EFN56272.1 hypothetical protein CHLNCDRAFT_51958 [Chlorella variabilis]|eukprot:XP_005848374.1 hypothetical protein CHLNCDRAFT_51958 [Chlorella variabilis]